MNEYVIEKSSTRAKGIKTKEIITDGLRGSFYLSEHSVPYYKSYKKIIDSIVINCITGITIGTTFGANSISFIWTFNPVSNNFDIYVYIIHKFTEHIKYVSSVNVNEKVFYNICISDGIPYINLDNREILVDDNIRYQDKTIKSVNYPTYSLTTGGAPHLIKVHAEYNPY